MASEAAGEFQRRISEFELDCARRLRRAADRTDIVFLGDSIAALAPAIEGWVNRGIAGDKLQSDAGDVFDRLGTDRLHPNPRAIVLLMGRDAVLQSGATADTLADLSGHLLTQLGYHHPTAERFVVSVPPVAPVHAEQDRRVLAFNLKLKELAALNGSTFLDLHAKLTDASGTATKGVLESDGTTLSRSGMSMLVRFLADAVRAVGGGAPGVERGSQQPLFDVAQLAKDILSAYGREAWIARPGSATDEEIVQNFIVPEVDYFVRYLGSGAHAYRDLYVGSRAKFIAANERLWTAQPGGVTGLAQRDRTLWLESLAKQQVAADIAARVGAVHDEIAPFFAVSEPAPVHLLFIGDCLLEDVELLIGADLLRQGMLADIDPIVSKNPAEQLKEIRSRAGKKFAGVVYSPLSWEFDQDFRKAFDMTLQSRASIDADINAMTERIDKRVRLLADLFDCNIYVHNTAAVLRASSDRKRRLRSVATHYKRDRVRQGIAAFLAKLVAEINAASFEHLYVVDEAAAVRDTSDDQSLGRFLYYVQAIHPAELSVVVAQQIARYVAASVRLVGRKVIVCDLDNTLWDGVIGEGLGVRHCRDRQRVLLELKKRGVVLAICSKNDPANVKWEHSVLTADDFVASEISWGPKVAGVGRVAETLNLKTKDFVFIDDRADERAMVAGAHAKLTALDPCDESTWTLFRSWTQLLSTAVGADRTEMYKQRAEREKILAAVTDDDDSAETFKSLALKLQIRRSSSGDLKRIHELINRTNQWNLQGSRCTFQEVKDWHESPEHRIYTASVKDKFGDMGLVSVCIAAFEADALVVNIFVLSCRVFGYGVETVILRQLEKDATERFGTAAVRGFFVTTPHNAPSKDFYVRHGYIEKDGAWVASGGRGVAPEPTWFERISLEK